MELTTRQMTRVLILVVVEDGLVHFVNEVAPLHSYFSLNPCCSGRWSRTGIELTFRGTACRS